ncbi:MAG: DUF3616 domain-containing protein [Bradyrhizobium sp.]
MRLLRIGTILLIGACVPAAAEDQLSIVEYSGMCDASAAIALENGIFVVASDEDNILRVYRRGEPAAAQSIPLGQDLKVDPDEPEVDLEGAARVGDTIYWTASHSQSKKGKLRTSRHRLFATTVAKVDGQFKITLIRPPYLRLREDLIKAPQLKKFGLEAAAQLAPEAKGGFNIEGLAVTPDGGLLLGFRNPLTKDGKALVVPIKNPSAVLVEGKSTQIELGEPAELVLGGRGIRSIEWSETRKRYLVVAGPTDDTGTFALYSWSGDARDAAVEIPEINFGTLNPEAMFFEPGDAAGVQVISDDGGRKIEGKDCKEAPPSKQRFRGTTLTLR